MLAEVKRAESETELARGCHFGAKEDVTYEPADLILKRSPGALREKRDELRDVFEIVKLRVKRQEEGHLERTPEVGGWLKIVGDLLPENEVFEILKQGREEMEKVSRHGVGDDPQSQRAYRAFYILNWIYCYFTEPHYVHWIPWISRLIQTMLYADFFYYFHSWKNNKRLELPA